MELIDKKGKINKVTFKQIVQVASIAMSTISIYADTIDLTSNAENLLIDLFTLEVPNDAKFEMHLKLNDTDYVFTGKDFNWFLKADRLSDLSMYIYGKDVFGFEETKKEMIEQTTKKVKSIKPVKLLDTTIYHVAIASIKDPENPIIHDFSGYKVECVKWLNQQIVQNATLQNEVEMLLCLNYDVDDPEWKTLKELFDEGKIDIC